MNFESSLILFIDLTALLSCSGASFLPGDERISYERILICARSKVDALPCPPSSPLPHCGQNLTLTPFSLCVLRYHTSEPPGFVIQKSWLQPVAATYFQLPNQKQTAITVAPSSSSSSLQASGFINPCPCDACFPPGQFIPTEGRWCKNGCLTS